MKKHLPLITLLLLMVASVNFAQELPEITAKSGEQTIMNSFVRGRMVKNQSVPPKMIVKDISLIKPTDMILNHTALIPENVIISNLNEEIVDYGIADDVYIFGQSFKTDQYKYSLESVTLSIEDSPGEPLGTVLKLYSSDSEGKIGTELPVTFSTPVKIGDNLYNFESSSTQILSANTIYWLIFNSSSSTYFNYTESLDNDGPGSFPATNLWAQSDDGGTSYEYGDDEPFLFAVYGTKLPLSWTGNSDSDWFKAANWDPQVVPTMADDVVIPPGKSNYPTISGGTPLFKSIVIQSDATGTGSFILDHSPEDNFNIQRYMTGNGWHLIGSPVSSMGIGSFLTNNSAIPTKNINTRGMMDYNPSGNTWNDFFTNSTGGSLLTGKGYALRTSTDAVVTFTGNINAGNHTISGLSAGNWNLTGNPYTSALGVTNGATTAQKFLAQNASNLDPSYQALYVWEGDDINGQYKIISNVNVPGKSLAQHYIQPVQGFFVKMASDKTDILFSSEMQAHVSEASAPFKSATLPWPYITLNVSSGEKTSSASVTFNEAMTRGLDPSYDVGAFNLGSDLMISTRLVHDNGVQFAIQALPMYGLDEMEIPIDIKTVSGGLIELSAKANGLSNNIGFNFEDRELNIVLPVTDSDFSYKVEFPARTISSGRFYLVPARSVTGINPHASLKNLKTYMEQNQIVIEGPVGKDSRVSLHDIHGRVMFAGILNEGGRNLIEAPTLVPGIYLLTISGEGEQVTLKLPVSRKK